LSGSSIKRFRSQAALASCAAIVRKILTRSVRGRSSSEEKEKRIQKREEKYEIIYHHRDLALYLFLFERK